MKTSSKSDNLRERKENLDKIGKTFEKGKQCPYGLSLGYYGYTAVLATLRNRSRPKISINHCQSATYLQIAGALSLKLKLDSSVRQNRYQL